MRGRSPEELQRQYYAATGAQYDDLHTSDQMDEHYLALHVMDSLADSFGLKTFLDVGAGTGRGVLFLAGRRRNVTGVEPVKELIVQAVSRGASRNSMIRGTGYALPFENQSVDAVFECGVLHHVAHPSRVVAEMARVAKKAIFLSDGNRFGQGRYSTRVLKLLAHRAHLWRAFRFVRTLGRMYSLSDGDGLAYSYSVYDSYAQIAREFKRVWLIPTRTDGSVVSWLGPLLEAENVLLCAFRG